MEVSNGVWAKDCINSKPGSNCTAVCNQGYSGIFTSQCNRGTWSSVIGTCEEDGEHWGGRCITPSNN